MVQGWDGHVLDISTKISVSRTNLVSTNEDIVAVAPSDELSCAIVPLCFVVRYTRFVIQDS
jgi:hypothetical protein